MAALTLLPLHAVAGKDHSISTTDGKPADMTQPVQVFILLGQSNMVGLGKIKGGDSSLEFAVKEKQKYPYLADEAGTWNRKRDRLIQRPVRPQDRLHHLAGMHPGKGVGPIFEVPLPAHDGADVETAGGQQSENALPDRPIVTETPL